MIFRLFKKGCISAVIDYADHHYELDFRKKTLSYHNTMNSYDNGSSYPADYFAVKRCLVDSECIKMCSEKIEQMISEEILKPEKLPVLPPGVSRGAFMVVQFKNRMYYYTNKIVQEHLYSVESLPVNAQFLEIVCLITPLCVFPEMSLAELQDLRSGLFSEKVLKKVNSFEENLFSDKDHQFTVYIYDARRKTR